MSRNDTPIRSAPPVGTSNGASRRLTVRFPNSDQAAAAFHQTQTNVSRSLRVLIRQYVETQGARDVLGLVLEQVAGATSGGSPAAGSESAEALAAAPPRATKRSASSGQPPQAVRRRDSSAPALADSTQLDMDEIFAMAAAPSSSTGVVAQ